MIRLIANKIHWRVALASVAILGGCYNPDRELITRDGSHARLVDDNPEVERLLSVQKARDDEIAKFWREKHTNQEGVERIKDMLVNPEQYAPGRKEFLVAMSEQPGVFVPEKTYARLLQSSGAHCTPRPGYTTVYVKVRITTGAFMGREGWVCEDDCRQDIRHAVKLGRGYPRLMERASSADDTTVAVRRSKTRASQQGFVLIVTSIALTILLAFAALGIDIGRMYVIRAELQSFTDAAALSAAMELDGTDSGLANARAGAQRLATGPHAMQWDLGTRPITNIATTFSTDNKKWQEASKPAADSRFVRVVASEPAPVIFMRIFHPLGLASPAVASSSVAAKVDGSARLIQ